MLERLRTWNVRVYDTNGGTAHASRYRYGQWLGTVEGRNEQDARHAALSKFNIPADVNFEVSPR
jgi:hypothetical protein